MNHDYSYNVEFVGLQLGSYLSKAVSEDVAGEANLVDSGFAILSVLRTFDEAGRPAPPTEQIAALARQRKGAASTALAQLAESGDIQAVGSDAYEITDRGRTALARAERDGLV